MQKSQNSVILHIPSFDDLIFNLHNDEPVKAITSSISTRTPLLSSWRHWAGLHSNPMPETSIMDVYPRYPLQVPEVHDTPSIHSQFTITHISITSLPLPPHHWCLFLLFIPHIPQAHRPLPNFNSQKPTFGQLDIINTVCVLQPATIGAYCSI